MLQDKAQKHLEEKLEKHWERLKIESAPIQRQPSLLRQFLIFNRYKLLEEHPLIQKAKSRLNQLESETT